MRGVLGILGASAALLALLASEGGLSAAPVASRVLTFADRGSGNVLTIETAAGAPDAGRFAFLVPGRGLFLSVDLPTVEYKEKDRLKVRYRGLLDLIPESEDGLVAPRRLAGRLQAELDVTRHRAEAQLHLRREANSQEEDEEEDEEDEEEDEEDEVFRLRTAQLDARDALRTAATFERAALAGDWVAVHALLASTLRTSISAAAFAASIEAQRPSVGTLVRLRREGASGVQVASGGVRFVVLHYTAAHTLSDDRTLSRRYDAYFVFEEGTWKLWFTEER